MRFCRKISSFRRLYFMPDKNKPHMVLLTCFCRYADVPGAHRLHQVGIYQRGRKYRRLSGVRITLVRYNGAAEPILADSPVIKPFLSHSFVVGNSLGFRRARFFRRKREHHKRNYVRKHNVERAVDSQIFNSRNGTVYV